MTSTSIKELGNTLYTEIYQFRPRGKYKGDKVSITYGRGQLFPWAISYRGNGHYFRTLPEAVAFAAGRRLIPEHMTEDMIDRVNALMIMAGYEL